MKNQPSPENAKPTSSADGVKFDGTATCDVCGKAGAFQFHDRKVCEDCYAGAGSCCPEFGKDDLWEFPNDS